MFLGIGDCHGEKFEQLLAVVGQLKRFQDLLFSLVLLVAVGRLSFGLEQFLVELLHHVQGLSVAELMPADRASGSKSVRLGATSWTTQYAAMLALLLFGFLYGSVEQQLCFVGICSVASESLDHPFPIVVVDGSFFHRHSHHFIDVVVWSHGWFFLIG